MRLKWDQQGERLYETGIKNCVLYTQTTDLYDTATAWNGITSINEAPTGAEPNDLWADDMKYLSLMSAEELGLTINAYMYPDAFAECDGSAAMQYSSSAVPGLFVGQQDRKIFGLCYKTTIGNDTQGNAYGYKLHLVYGCKVSPSDKDYTTINDSPDANEFSWEVNCTPINVEGYKPVYQLTIDSTKATKANLTALEDILYGTGTDETGTDGYLPLPEVVAKILATGSAS